ncbi:MAG: methyltransferase domain-containing protein [Spirochaetales bacterium]|nr:methyltransferase domain-containing protein [Spirochaetales bacterium]
MAVQANIDRFDGFAKLYDDSRPVPPPALIDAVLLYAGRKPSVVADVGSGTGLSTFPWASRASRVVGIEPNRESREYARSKATRFGNVEFVDGWSDRIGLADASADVVTVSQAFHWMEPESSLAEFGRILKPGGVLAVYDCAWPLVMGRELETLHADLIARANRMYAERNEGEAVAYREKAKHPAAFAASGLFAYTREIFLHDVRRLSADGVIGIAVSQGAVQTALKRWPDDFRPLIEEYEKKVRELVKGKIEAMYCYELVVGVKDH